VVGASLYIIICSAKNRIRVRMRRLREPRYLIGALVGVAYLYFTFFARSRSSQASAARRSRRGTRGLPAPFVAVLSAAPAFAALGLLVVSALSWLVPVSSGLLDFSEAETQFLFPAPVSRRQLLLHRILRSQIGLLFSAIIVGVVTPSMAGTSRLRVSIATWFLLITAKIYFTGLTLARTQLLSPSPKARRAAWLPVGLLASAVAVVAVALARAFIAAPPEDAVDGLTRINETITQGAARVALWPFVAVVTPLFSAWPQPYVSALAISAAMLTIVVVWVMRSDEAFQDAAVEAAERRARQPHPHAAIYKVRASGWKLAATGRAEAAFAWKAAAQTLRIVDRRTIVRLAAPLIALTIAAVSLGRANSLATAVGVFATVGAVFAVMMGPQALRIDMRQDLRHLEVLKTWPVSPAAVVRGEMMWPGALLTVAAWSFLTIAAFLSGTVFPTLGFVTRTSTAAAVAIVAPALIFAQLTIHNAAALIFPAWIPVGNQRPRGLDALGQRLIMLTATLLMLIAMTLPGAIAGGIVWFAFRAFLGTAAVVPGALVCAAIVIVEVLVATEALGPAYERLDVLAVERGE
jgi:hypothetical protein